MLFCSTKMVAILDTSYKLEENEFVARAFISLNYYGYKLNRTLTLLGFVFCIGVPKGTVTD